MENPFDILNERLIRIETLLIEISTHQKSVIPAQVSAASVMLIGDKALAKYLGCTIQTVSRLKKQGNSLFTDMAGSIIIRAMRLMKL